MKIRLNFLIGLMVLGSCASLDNSNQASLASRLPPSKAYTGTLMVPNHQLPAQVSPAARKMIQAKSAPRTIAIISPKAILPPKASTKASAIAALGPEDLKARVSPSSRLPKGKPAVSISLILPIKVQKIAPLTSTGSPEKVVAKPNPTPPPTFLPGTSGSPSVIPQTASKPLTPGVMEKDISTQAGADLLLQFNKLNWNLIASEDDRKKSGFQERRFERDKTTFLFRPQNPGKLDLVFERQDLSTGTQEIQKYHWTIGPKGLALGIAESTTSSSETMDTAQVLKEGESLERIGDWDGALKLYQKNYKPEVPELNDRLAKIYQRRNVISEAEKYWERNLTSTDSAVLGRALTGLTDLRLNNDKGTKVLSLPTLWVSSNQVPEEMQFLRILDQVQSLGQESQALSWAENYGRWYKNPSKLDWYLYLKAKIYEKPTELRNIRESLKLYNEIQENHPFSPFWKEAGERVNFLNRNYFQVR